MNWALEQRGLSAGQKLVLFVLADCYSPFGECSPPQEYLAFVTDLSRSSVNRALSELEGLGLIAREPRRGDDGKAQSTTYRLLFDDELAAASVGTLEPSHHIPAHVRAEVFARDANSCLYCGCELVGSERCIDHIIPRCRGGSDDPENLATACRSCNSQKGELSVIEFLKKRGSEI